MTDETERLTQHITQDITQHITQRFEDEEVAETQRFDSEQNPDVVETYVRFGPGVPAQVAPAPDRATAIWRGEVRPVGTADEAAERRSRRWVLPLTVLILVIAVVIYYFWGRTTNPVAVTSVAVKATTQTVTKIGTWRTLPNDMCAK